MSDTEWDTIEFPGSVDQHAYALEVSGDSMQPLYRPGDYLIISPSAPVRKGDRVVVKTKYGEVMAKVIAKMDRKKVELHAINPAYPPRVLSRDDIDWMARIVWAKQ